MTAGPLYIDPKGRRDALVNPEAVTIDLPIADLGTRSLSALIDLTTLFMASYLITVAGVAAVGLAVGGSEWIIVVAALVLGFATFWGAPVASEVLWKGRTPGKAALGLRVVTVDGGPVRFRHAAIRWLMAFVDFYLFLGIPAIITAMVTARSQRLGDVAAGTVVVRERSTPAKEEQPVRWTVPPALVSYARTLDVSGLDSEDYALIRAFLLRAGDLLPEHRAGVAAEIATTAARRMRHAPPPGTHPEALLICAAALLQHRDQTPVARQPDVIDPFA